jgi:hypothetical protein
MEYSAAFRWELARNSSAVSHRRAAMSWISSFGGEAPVVIGRSTVSVRDGCRLTVIGTLQFESHVPAAHRAMILNGHDS